MKTPLLAVVAVAACGGGQAAAPRPLGVEGNLAEAHRHEDEAEIHDQQAEEASARAVKTSATCADRALSDQVTSGGERLLNRSPCWTARDDEDQHRALAADLRADASAHRARARELAQAEQDACAAMPQAELDHTPFFHRPDVAAVSALVERGRVRGALVRFQRVAGLTAAWLREAIACHQARAAALGWPADHFGYDPTMVAGTATTVEEVDHGFLVVVRSDDDSAALAAYGRAEDLLDPDVP